MQNRRAPFIVLAFLVLCSSAFAYDVGVAKVDVTPTGPIRMSGYGSRLTESEGVEQPLFAKALAIRDDANSPPLVLITVDTLGVPEAITAAVAERLRAKHNVPRENVAVCASHTHTGPIVAGVAPLILTEPVKQEEKQHIDQYTGELTAKLGDVAEKAIAALRPGRLEYAVGKLTFAMNRRVLKEGHWTGFGDVPEGPVDHGLPVLFLYDGAEGKKLRAVVVNYACHCTTLGGKFMNLHGDWAGAFQEQFEREHPGTTALVSIGCGADANPAPRGDYAQAREHGDAMYREVAQLLKGKTTPIVGSLTAKRETFELPMDPLPTRAEWEERLNGKGAIVAHAKANLARLDRGEKLPTTVPYSAQSWSFGKALAMVFLPGEVVVDYQLRLKRELDGKRLWLNAYANDIPCYIASKRILGEGGYEVDSSMYYYDRPQHLAPAVEQLIVDRVRGVVPEAFNAAMRFAGEIEKIVGRERENPPPTGGILFIGSSTIRMWKLDRWLSDLPAINHGFGGSYISDSNYFFDRLVTPVKPRQVVMYAGGNDIASGKPPEQVCQDFTTFAARVRREFPEARLTYIATAPNVKRWPIIDKTRAANRLIERAIADMKSPLVEFVEIEDKLLGKDGQPQPGLYIADGLHLNDAGYEILTNAVRPYLR